MSVKAIVFLQSRGAIFKDLNIEHYNYFEFSEDEAREKLNNVGFDFVINRDELWVRLEPTDHGKSLFNNTRLTKTETLILFYLYKKYNNKDLGDIVFTINLADIYNNFKHMYEDSYIDNKKGWKLFNKDLLNLEKNKIVRILENERLEVRPLIRSKIRLEDLEQYKFLLENELNKIKGNNSK